MKKKENSDFRRGTPDATIQGTITKVCEHIESDQELCMQRLWKAVILTAFQDAMRTSQKPILQLEKRQAIHWLLRNKKDFTMVCDHANLEPRFVRQVAWELLQKKSDELTHKLGRR